MALTVSSGRFLFTVRSHQFAVKEVAVLQRLLSGFRLFPPSSAPALLRAGAVVLALSALAAPVRALDEKIMGEACALREQGEFEKATTLLRVYLDQTSGALSADDRQAVEFEIERIRRIRQDYRLTRERLLKQLEDRLTTITAEELDRYEREGKLDVQVIDGRKLYVNSSASNLVLAVPELQPRRRRPRADGTLRKLYNHMKQVEEARRLTPDRVLLPQDFGVTYTLIVRPNAVEEGKTIRAWLPYVRSFPHQTDAWLLSSEPGNPVLAPAEAPHRTVYLERRAVKDQPTTFSIHFVYRSWARVSQVDPERVEAYRKDAPEYAYYAQERKPHIDFGDEELRKLNAQIVDGETNPYRIARRIYDWIARNTIYQYAREYSTIENLSRYCALRRGGDCGQHTMLFIALCRMNGIPARWTTGWESFEARRNNNMHDWCEFYVEPYGWLPVDVDMAVNALRHAEGELNTTESLELADWLFGNMDHFRLTTNADFGAPLFPPKADFRSETVDFQRGEVESDGRNLYFDQWDWEMEIRPIEPEEAQRLAGRFRPAAGEQDAVGEAGGA